MHSYSEIRTFKDTLSVYWQPKLEKCGVILFDQAVEKANLHPVPEDNFEFAEGDLDGATASWHSHPSGLGNLSIGDYWFFMSWPSMLHFIISETQVRCYGVLEGSVRNIDEAPDYSAWLLGQTPS